MGHQACRDSYSVLRQRVPKLFAELASARGDGRYARILRSLGGVQLLIIDDCGLSPVDAGARHELLEILEERYGRGSTISSSLSSSWTNVTLSSKTPPTQMPSLIASFTTLIALVRAAVCGPKGVT
jgi:DNA replication protein DnaC